MQRDEAAYILSVNEPSEMQALAMITVDKIIQNIRCLLME
jgi:hypothetical protein